MFALLMIAYSLHKEIASARDCTKRAKKRRSRMLQLANAFMDEDENIAPAQPKMWSAISRVKGRDAPSKPGALCPTMNVSPQQLDASNFEIQTQIGEGNGGTTVHRCRDNRTGKQFALKVVPRIDYQPSRTEALLMDQWESVHSILPSHVTTKDNCTYMSMELAEGGDLLERILKHGVMSEAQTARIIHRLATALNDLHRTMGVCHRDVKPENVCIMDPSDPTSVKLCDFEHARPLIPPGHVYTHEESEGSAIGSLNYMAPERFYGVAAGAAGDCWGLGVLAYCLLRAELPFVNNPVDRRCPQMLPRVWDGLSAGAVDLISGLLDLNPDTRLGMENILSHQWIIQTESESRVKAEIRRAHAQALELSRLVHLAESRLGNSHQEQDCKA